MSRAVTVTVVLAAAWALGGVWYYDCKIKRVCGPHGEAARPAPQATAVPAAPQAVPAAQPSATVATLATGAAASPPPPARPGAEAGVTMLLLRVRFDPRSSELVLAADAAASLATLRGMVADGAKLRVTGHSDSRGLSERIAIVSRERAERLRDWLIARGIPASAIGSVESRGDTEPLAPNDTAEGRAKNRRAEVWLQP